MFKIKTRVQIHCSNNEKKELQAISIKKYR
jgi:hypothetical protein